jgi:hypothetical protein
MNNTKRIPIDPLGTSWTGPTAPPSPRPEPATCSAATAGVVELLAAVAISFLLWLVFDHGPNTAPPPVPAHYMVATVSPN